MTILKFISKLFDITPNDIQLALDNINKNFSILFNLFEEKMKPYINLIIKLKPILSCLDLNYIIYDKNILTELSKNNNILDNKKELNKFIINYYIKENFKNLEDMIISWNGSNDNILTKRISILNASLEVGKTCNNKDFYFSTSIPLLLAQLTGINEDIYNKIPKDKIEEIKKCLKENLKKENDNRNKIMVEFLYRYKPDSFLIYYGQINQKTLLNGYSIEKYEKNSHENKFDLFRHKILHGDKKYLDYSNEKNFIICWLQLNFLINIYNDLSCGVGSPNPTPKATETINKNEQI